MITGPSRPSRIFRSLLTAALAVALAAAPAPWVGPALAGEAATAEPAPEPIAEPLPAPAPDGRQAFAEVVGYFCRDGGGWRSPNHDHRPGDGAAVEYRYHFEPLFEGSLVLTRISGVGEDGAETTYWQVVNAWHPDGSIRLFNFGRDGDFGSGGLEVVSADEYRLEIDLINQEGQEYRLREEMVKLGPDRFRSTSYVWRDGAWSQVEEATWTRIGE